jgi:hypothetical protein
VIVLAREDVEVHLHAVQTTVPAVLMGASSSWKTASVFEITSG